jgi:hypothetical protein
MAVTRPGAGSHHGTIGLVTVDKMSVSFESALGDDIRQAARRAGLPLSTWLAEAAAEKLRGDALDEFLADWQAEHGAFTPEELVEADRSLGLMPNRPR